MGEPTRAGVVRALSENDTPLSDPNRQQNNPLLFTGAANRERDAAVGVDHEAQSRANCRVEGGFCGGGFDSDATARMRRVIAVGGRVYSRSD